MGRDAVVLSHLERTSGSTQVGIATSTSLGGDTCSRERAQGTAGLLQGTGKVEGKRESAVPRKGDGSRWGTRPGVAAAVGSGRMQVPC